MRKVIYSTGLTLDGYINHDAVNADEELHEYHTGTMSEAGAAIMGRVTYKLMEDYWPLALTDPTLPKDMIEFARAIDAVPKIVFSRTLKSVDWNNTTLMREVDPAAINAMKQEPGGDLMIGSGARLARTFINLGLVDEFRLMYFPTILGGGLSLFEGLTNRIDLELMRTRTFGSGAILLVYRVKTAEGEAP